MRTAMILIGVASLLSACGGGELSVIDSSRRTATAAAPGSCSPKQAQSALDTLDPLIADFSDAIDDLDDSEMSDVRDELRDADLPPCADRIRDRLVAGYTSTISAVRSGDRNQIESKLREAVRLVETVQDDIATLRTRAD